MYINGIFIERLLNPKYKFRFTIVQFNKEDQMEGLELLCFKLISDAGSARSSYIEAIREAKKGNFEKANELIKEGSKYYLAAHDSHNDMIKRDLNDESTDISILVMHAEDQLMSAEMFQILAKEFIDMYRELIDLRKKEA